MPGQIGNKGGGRKTHKEEFALIKYYESLLPKVFSIVRKKLDSKSKVEQKWALDWLKPGFVKMIPQQVTGDPENPLIFVPADLITKNEISSGENSIPRGTETSSEGQAQISDSQLRSQVGQDNTSGLGDVSQSGGEGQQPSSLPSTDLPTGQGHSVDSFIESLPTNSD